MGTSHSSRYVLSVKKLCSSSHEFESFRFIRGVDDPMLSSQLGAMTTLFCLSQPLLKRRRGEAAYDCFDLAPLFFLTDMGETDTTELRLWNFI